MNDKQPINHTATFQMMSNLQQALQNTLSRVEKLELRMKHQEDSNRMLRTGLDRMSNYYLVEETLETYAKVATVLGRH